MIEMLVASPKAERLAAHFDDDLFAPDLLVCETLGAVRSMVRRGEVCDHEGSALIAHLASYVALAEELRAPLITTDIGLARAAEPYIAVIAI